VVALQAPAERAALELRSEGDATQGLIFSVICLTIVAGIYLLVVKEQRPVRDGAEAHDAFRRLCPCLPWSTLPPGEMLTLRPQVLSSRRLGQPLSGKVLAPSRLPTGPLDPRISLGRRPQAEEWNTELPMIYPQLVVPVAHTRLAVPSAPLGYPQFEVDVLGLSGVPLLSAALVANNSGARSVQISLHSVTTLLAVVTPRLEIFGADGTNFGKIVKEDKLGDGLQYVLQDRLGLPILTLTSARRDGRDFRMTSVYGGRVVERATVARRPQGKLPAEHYEIVANPNVDAVLVLACFLAVVVFDPVIDMPTSAMVLPSLPPSGRPSTVLRSEPQSLTGMSWVRPQ